MDTKDLYKIALTIRLSEQKIADTYHEQEMRCPTHLYLGEEAIATGVCSHLRKDDTVYAYFRSHGWYLAKGGSIQGLISELYGKVSGCSKGFGGSPHLIDLENGFQGSSAIVAGSIPHALGTAYTFKQNKTNQVAVTAFGDGATEEGVFHESLMFAALRKLPVVFICENNRLATNTRIEDRQPNDLPIFERAKGLGIKNSFKIDGNNALEVSSFAKEAVERARNGEGPTFLECETFRIMEHVGHETDYDMSHRIEEEVEHWKVRDPIFILEKELDSNFVKKLREEINTELDQAISFAKQDKFPTNLVPEGMV
jgi:TPP-dependent pyruvate/acetoin dehydrogenase alpha subunit